MKRSFKLMQIYEIQRDYNNHKQKLKSISQADSKRKVSIQSSRHISPHQTFKKVHNMSTQYFNKETTKKISKQNDYLYQTLVKENGRKPQKGMNQSLSSSSSAKSLMRNTSLTIKMSRIKQQNQKIMKKLQSTRSNYEQIRKQRLNRTVDHRPNQQEQLKRFLQNQFRIKPTVLFPAQIKKPKTSQKPKKQTVLENKNLMPKIYSKQTSAQLSAKNKVRAH